MIRKLTIWGLGLLGITVVGLAAFIASAPPLPLGTDAIIDSVLASGPPEWIPPGTRGTAMSGDVEIWFESISDRPKAESRGTVLLIMGLGMSGTAWTEGFFRPLVDAGYRVVRYDHRDIGLSDWIEGWDSEAPYTLEDMARDGLAVLDELGVEQAHIVGISMGGMIGQRLAISHRDRVLSLTSMSSTGYALDPLIPPVRTGRFQRGVVKLALRYGLNPTEKNRIKMGLGFSELLKGDGDYSTDVRRFATGALVGMESGRVENRAATEHHGVAVEVSGSRYEQLPSISVPTLVIHGRSDPLIPPAHSEEYAPMIPGAELLIIDGMGHDLPSLYLPGIHDAILELLERVDVPAGSGGL